MKKKNDKRLWGLLLVLLAVGFVAFRYSGYLRTMAIYGFGMANHVEFSDGALRGITADYLGRTSWNGERIPIIIGAYAYDTAYPSWATANLQPAYDTMQSLMTAHNIMPGESICEVRLSLGACDEDSCDGLGESVYPVSPSVPLIGKLQSTDKIIDVYHMEGPFYNELYFYYWHPYDCVLDTPYPVDQLPVIDSHELGIGLQLAIFPVSGNGTTTPTTTTTTTTVYVPPEEQEEPFSLLMDFVQNHIIELVAASLALIVGLYFILRK